MKVGDLVKRSDTFKEWMKFNSWMALEEEQEIGIISRFDKENVVVLWSVIGLSWEDKDNIEVLSEDRRFD